MLLGLRDLCYGPLRWRSRGFAMQTGLFFAIEGIDGAGSTTQAKALCGYLKQSGRPNYFTAEPSKGPLGQVARQFLRGEVQAAKFQGEILALCFAADRLYHYEQEIAPKLKQGIHVVSDRYLLSSLAYQTVMLDAAWVSDLNRFAPLPDMTVIIDVTENIAARRRTIRGGHAEIFDDLETQRHVRDNYLRLARSVQATIIDGSAAEMKVSEGLFACIDKYFSLHQ